MRISREKFDKQWNEMWHFQNYYLWLYNKNDSIYKKRNVFNLIKFKPNNLQELSRIQEKIFLETINQNMSGNTIIVFPPLKQGNLVPLQRLFNRISNEYRNQIMTIKSQPYQLKRLGRNKRIKKILKVSEGWKVAQQNIKINEETNFLFIDDVYTSGATLFGIVNFILKTFYYGNYSSFVSGGFSAKDNKNHLNFNKLKGIFFSRTWPEDEKDWEKKKQYIHIDENEFSRLFNCKFPIS